MDGKQFLILEKTDSKLEVTHVENDSAIYLEGIFTEFNVRNRNNRIYSADDFLPKMEALRPRIKNHTLLGELDHPSNFDVSLQNVSHVIEDLRYDRENNRVIGKIRLLNTRAGKDAQALVRDGIPLHISSRAAGNIDAAGHVTLTSLFTYDLVADPGFEDAQLHQVSESYTFDGCAGSREKCLNEQFGFNDNPNVKIYECELTEEYINANNMEQQGNVVSAKDFQRYTEYIAEVLNGVRLSVSKLEEKIGASGDDAKVSEKIEKLSRYANYLAEQIELSHKHGDYLAEQIEKGFRHNDYLAETIEKGFRHNDYLAEQIEKTQKHSDYLAEQLENGIKYSEYLGENLNNSIKYSGYLAENIDKGFAHNDYLAEKLEQNFAHNDYLAEKLEQNFSHNDYLAEKLNVNFRHNDYLAEKLEQNYKHNDYLAEKLEQNYKHNDYLAEQLENSIDGKPINEGNAVPSASAINEGAKPGAASPKVNPNKEYMETFSAKLDAILEKAAASVTETNFMNLLSEKRQAEFATLDASAQKTITEAMNAAAVKNEAQADAVWKNVYESKKGLDIVDNMPEVFRGRWDSLSESRKGEILEEAKFYDLKTQDTINKFWETRDLRERQVAVTRTNTDSAKIWENNSSEQDKHMASILSRTKRGIVGY